MNKIVALLLCTTFVALSAVASADELPQLPRNRISLSEARRTLVSGEYSDARAILSALAVDQEHPKESAAAKQLAVVLSEWEKQGRPPSPRRALRAPRADEPWLEKLRASLVMLVDGWYAPAAKTLDELTETAPDPTSRVVASQMRSLAIEADEASAPRPAPVAAEPEPIKTTKWYGWQTLIVDGASILAAPAYCAGCISYAIGAPIIHAAHGRWGAAGGSLGLRLGLPVVFGLAGAGLERASNDGRCSGHMGCLGGLLLGGVIGIGSAIALDAAVIARKDVERAEPPRESFWRNARPSIAPRREGGVEIGLATTF